MQIFEQQPKETNKAFAAFQAYLNQGPERTLAGTAKALHKSLRQIERWSSESDWAARAAAYTAHFNMVERLALEEQRRAHAAEWASRLDSLRQQEWDMHTQCLEAAAEALQGFRASGRVPTVADMARLFELASKLGRLATELGTDRTEGSGQEGGSIHIQIETALRKVYGDVIDVEPVPQLPPYGTH